MVAPNKNQTVELSPSFSKKDVLEQHTKESAAVPLLETESEPATHIHEHLDIPSSPSSPITITSATNNKNNKKSVSFSENVHVKEIPMLTEEEKIGMFTTKQEKRESKILIKRLVKYYRADRSNSFFFAPANHASASEEIQIPPEERTKIGLEPHLNPQMKLAIRRRMWKLVLQHQDWSRQHPTFFDDQFLAKNCTTVAKSASLLAVERAQTVVAELANDRKQKEPRGDIRIMMSSSYMKSASSEDHSVDIFATPAATTTPAIETVAVDATATNRMEAPGQTCMVR